MIEIDQAFVSAFIAGGFGLPIEHENEEFTPQPGEAYVSIKVLLNEAVSRGICEEDDVTGVFQFIVRYPTGSGAIPAKQKVAEIFNQFPIDSDISYGGQAVRITGHASPFSHPEDGWFKLVRRVNFRAFVPRQ